MTIRDQLAATGRQNADSLGVGLPALLMLAAEQWLGLQLPTEVAILAAALLGSWGAKIKRVE
ncbi:hypothetical protein ACFQH5_20275 [Halomonas salifodinae]|uniref:Uncharacterized protein n=1 Tax=Halomonas salifodinae TaxID=438745 RepID=A0ABW2F1H3_9GAMM